MAAEQLARRSGCGRGSSATARCPANWTRKCCWSSPRCSRSPAKPQSYLWQLQQFYRETRDFRLLAGLADAVVGHTAGKVYPFLQGLSGVLSEVRDEATADSIVEQLAQGPASGRRPTVDQRALDLLEVLVERRAAEVLNQPGPHVEQALAAHAAGVPAGVDRPASRG